MALRDQPYLPLFVQDFLTDEKLIYCSASATGVYIRIMCLMHKSEHYGKILLKQKFKQSNKHAKNFASQLLVQMPYNLLEIENALVELLNEKVLTVDGDFLVQKRMVKDCEISEKRASAGRSGGKRTQGKASNNNKEFASKFAKAKNEANTEYEYEYENEYKDKGGVGEKDAIEEKKEVYAFDDFWDDYDKKRGSKEKLRRKWKKIPDKDKVHIRDYIRHYKTAVPDKQFRKDPETFLNNESWNDEIIYTNHGKDKKHITAGNADLDRLEWLARQAEEAFGS